MKPIASITHAILFFVSLLPLGVQSQTQPPLAGPGRPPQRDPLLIQTWSHPLPQGDGVGFQVFLQLSNDFLQFIQDDSLFTAQYEITVNVMKERGESVAGEIRKHAVQARDYGQTRSRQRLHRDRFLFTLPPGEYTLFVEIQDKATATPYRETRPLELKAPAPLSLTAPLFFHTGADTSEGNPPFPVFPAVQSQQGTPLEARLLLMANNPDLPILISHAFISGRNDTVSQAQGQIILEKSLQWIRLPIPQDLTFGQYRLIVQARQGQNIANAEASLSVQWAEHSFFMPDLDQAVEVLVYIMDKPEREALSKLEGEARREALEQFWKERDPTPQTKKNELEEEYYRRVAHASKNFGSWKNRTPGWKTDRGRVYILYGPPSLVEKPMTSASSNTQYEIWHYQHLNKKFLFRDRFNTGDFMLYAEE